MKNVILILGILTTVMVFGVVAGVSTNASPPALDMNLDYEQCIDCHNHNLINDHHPFNEDTDDDKKCCYCHSADVCNEPKKIEDQTNKCGNDNCCHNPTDIDPKGPVTDHHDFVSIFDNDDWDCLICHEKGVPRPLDK